VRNHVMGRFVGFQNDWYADDAATPDRGYLQYITI
jgi:hypothetical protein